MVNIVVGGSYEVLERIGEGSFGEVFRAFHSKTGVQYAIKREAADHSSPQLPGEVDMLRRLAGHDCVPKVHWYGREGQWNAAVLDLLGPNLKHLKIHFRKLPVKFVAELAHQMVVILETVHSHGIVYRDVKPDNFLVQRDFPVSLADVADARDSDDEASSPTRPDTKLLYQKRPKIHLVDFGLSCFYRNPETGQHVSGRQNARGKTGTARYASLNVHRGKVHSRRDDVESVGYLLIDLITGSLPWSGVTARNSREGWAKMKAMKEDLALEELCEGLPRGFMLFLDHARSLRFDQQPDYDYLRKVVLGTVGDGVEAEIVTISSRLLFADEGQEITPSRSRNYATGTVSPNGTRYNENEELHFGSPPKSPFYKQGRNGSWRTKNAEDIPGNGHTTRSNSMTLFSRNNSMGSPPCGPGSPPRNHTVLAREFAEGSPNGYQSPGRTWDKREKRSEPLKNGSKSIVRWDCKAEDARHQDSGRSANKSAERWDACKDPKMPKVWRGSMSIESSLSHMRNGAAGSNTNQSTTRWEPRKGSERWEDFIARANEAWRCGTSVSSNVPHPAQGASKPEPSLAERPEPPKTAHPVMRWEPKKESERWEQMVTKANEAWRIGVGVDDPTLMDPATPLYDTMPWSYSSEVEDPFRGFDGGDDWIADEKQTRAEGVTWAHGSGKWADNVSPARNGKIQNGFNEERARTMPHRMTRELLEIQSRRPSVSSPLNPAASAASGATDDYEKVDAEASPSGNSPGPLPMALMEPSLAPRRSTPNMRSQTSLSKLLKRSVPNLRELSRQSTVPQPSGTIKRTIAHRNELDVQQPASPNGRKSPQPRESTRPINIQSRNDGTTNHNEPRTTTRFSPQDARYSLLPQDARFSTSPKTGHSGRHRASTISHNPLPTQDVRFLPVPQAGPPRINRHRERSNTFTSGLESHTWQQNGHPFPGPGVAKSNSPPTANNGYRNRDRSYTFSPGGGRYKDTNKNSAEKRRPPPLQNIAPRSLNNTMHNQQQNPAPFTKEGSRPIPQEQGHRRTNSDELEPKKIQHVSFVEKPQVALLAPRTGFSHRRSSFTGVENQEKAFRSHGFTLAAGDRRRC